jgi:hypothetical protein
VQPKKRTLSRKANKKHGKKAKPPRLTKPRQSSRKSPSKKLAARSSHVIVPSPHVEPPAKERPVVTIGTIRGDTAIGDLLVAFPRTRDVLVRKGLRLDAEDAGDIYMTLDAFSAMNGLKTENLVLDILEVAKEPLTQPSVSQLVVAPAT